jgi:hypothetical protein
MFRHKDEPLIVDLAVSLAGRDVYRKIGDAEPAAP